MKNKLRIALNLFTFSLVKIAGRLIELAGVVYFLVVLTKKKAEDEDTLSE